MNQGIPEELVEAGRGYEALFVPALFAPWTGHVADAAGIKEESHVLDVACGTGVLARSALARTAPGGRVVGVDPAAGMLAVAQEIEPAVEWMLCSAEDLDLDDETFDCVVTQFGMMFFEDRGKAAAEMFRVLKPGGSAAIAVWNSVENNPAYADLIALLDNEVGAAAADALRLPFRLGDPEVIASELRGAGFTDVIVETRQASARFPSTRHMVEAELRGWLPLFDIFLDESKIDDVLGASDNVLAKYARASGEAVFPTSAHVIAAGRP